MLPVPLSRVSALSLSTVFFDGTTKRYLPQFFVVTLHGGIPGFDSAQSFALHSFPMKNALPFPGAVALVVIPWSQARALDQWETTYGINLSDPAKAMADWDQDGLTSQQEHDHVCLPRSRRTAPSLAMLHRSVACGLLLARP